MSFGFQHEAFVTEKPAQRLIFIGTPRALVGVYKFKYLQYGMDKGRIFCKVAISLRLSTSNSVFWLGTDLQTSRLFLAEHKLMRFQAAGRVLHAHIGRFVAPNPVVPLPSVLSSTLPHLNILSLLFTLLLSMCHVR